MLHQLHKIVFGLQFSLNAQFLNISWYKEHKQKEIIFALTIANCFHQKHLEEQITKADREYEEYASEDLLENIREIGDKYKKKAALLKASDE